MLKEQEILLYAYRKNDDSYLVDPNIIHTFKDMKDFEETSGLYAMMYFMQNPLIGLGFCYCYKGQDILKEMNIASYGFMED